MKKYTIDEIVSGNLIGTKNLGTGTYAKRAVERHIKSGHLAVDADLSRIDTDPKFFEKVRVSEVSIAVFKATRNQGSKPLVDLIEALSSKPR